MTNTPDYDTELAAVTACITALAEHGIPVDVQELLVNGSLQAGIKPHAIFNGIRAAYNTYQRPVGLDWKLNDDAKRQIAEIDANRRNAALNAGSIVAGAQPAPVDCEADFSCPTYKRLMIEIYGLQERASGHPLHQENTRLRKELAQLKAGFGEAPGLSLPSAK